MAVERVDVRGAAKLKAYCKEKKITYANVGQLLGLNEQTITQWAAAINRPSAKWWWILEVLCKIPPEDWLTSTEREQIAMATQQIAKLRRAKRVRPRKLSLREKIAGRL